MKSEEKIEIYQRKKQTALGHDASTYLFYSFTTKKRKESNMGKDLAPPSHALPHPLPPSECLFSSSFSELEKEVKSGMRMMLGLANKIEERMAELKEKEERWTEVEKRVSESTSKANSTVCLNVGMYMSFPFFPFFRFFVFFIICSYSH